MALGLVGLHFVAALVAAPFARRFGRWVFALCALPPAATVLWAVIQSPAVIAGRPVSQRLEWVSALGLHLDTRLDGFALLMVALVSGIGVLIFAYSAAYFSHRPGSQGGRGDAPGSQGGRGDAPGNQGSRGDAPGNQGGRGDAPGNHGRFAGTLVAFAGAMLGLVLVDNLLALYVFWELTTIASYLLIGFEDTKERARSAAQQGLLVTTAGGLVMLAGLVLLGQAAGTFSLSGLLAAPPTGGLAATGALLTLAGAFTKSAQAPFHFWLAGAMEAPTPVSAYLHSATMVKAGVYLIARLAPAFAEIDVWPPLVVGVGVATMLLGAARALRQHDLKLLLAYGTISQLGFMVALFGAGHPETTRAGAAVLLGHGAFKATLFLVVGIIDHAAGSRDIRQLSGLWRRMPGTFATAAIAAASMAGIPLLLGFVAKETAFEAAAPLPLAGFVAASALTAAYSLRFVWGGFADKPSRQPNHVHAPERGILAPAALLAALSVVLGVRPELASSIVNSAALALDARVEPEALKLWHGLNVALGLSVLAIACGVLLWAADARVVRLASRIGRLPDAAEGYARSVKALNVLAERVTGFVQSGSLPMYLGVILLAAVALPAPALLTAPRPDGLGVLADSPLQLAVAAGVAAAALLVVRARHRFAAVLFLGAVGYGMALLFVIQGAPDLALTQLLIETLTLVLFVLVLRLLPERFEPFDWRLGQALRRGVAVAVGGFVFVFAVLAGAARVAPPASEAYLADALDKAGGANVVNVILVDFRGLDTLGEITVLLVAALGVTALVRARRGRRERVPEGGDGGLP